MTTKSALDLYLKSQTAVKGWLDPYSAEVIAELGRFQAADGVAGSVGEIGVHHGRLFILLNSSEGRENRASLSTSSRMSTSILTCRDVEIAASSAKTSSDGQAMKTSSSFRNHHWTSHPRSCSTRLVNFNSFQSMAVIRRNAPTVTCAWLKPCSLRAASSSSTIFQTTTGLQWRPGRRASSSTSPLGRALRDVAEQDVYCFAGTSRLVPTGFAGFSISKFLPILLDVRSSSGYLRSATSRPPRPGLSRSSRENRTKS